MLAFALVGAAYDYQVFKGALAAVPVGQYEVGRALGMPAWVVYWKVVLPQMLPLAKKGWITYAIGTVKRIPIASAISVSEILYVTKQGIAATNAPFLFPRDRGGALRADRLAAALLERVARRVPG